VREDAEARMKRDRGPRTTVCSSTLELGIDIGRVSTVGQVGAPRAVAALRQRAGRSGRLEGTPQRLRIHVDCAPEGSGHPAARIPVALLQAIAVCELLVEGWIEPRGGGDDAAIDLSTFTHQVISAVLECGAVTAAELHRRLCVEGPFRALEPGLCARVLRALGRSGVIEQGRDGMLLLGRLGELLRRAPDFHAAFTVPTTFTVQAGATVLGTLPAQAPPRPGDHLVFAARRWRVASVDLRRARILVEPAEFAKRPIFSGGGSPVHRTVVERMRSILAGTAMPRWLDETAASALEEARCHARRDGLARRIVLEHRIGGRAVGTGPAAMRPSGGSIVAGCGAGATTADRAAARGAIAGSTWLAWSGTEELGVWAAMLRLEGIEVEEGRVGLSCDADAETVREVIRRAAVAPPPVRELARAIRPVAVRKYDGFLPEALLAEAAERGLIWTAPELDE